MTQFLFAHLKNISVNLKTGEITVSATVELNDSNFDKAEELRPYLEAEASSVTLEISPLQMRLIDEEDSHARED